MEKSCVAYFKPVFESFFKEIGRELNIDPEELASLHESSLNCLHKFTRGANSGTYCTRPGLENGYCGMHQNRETESRTVIPRAVAPTIGKSKNQLQIIEWMNTAVPQEETHLKKRSKGLFNEETEFIFNDEYLVIGKLNKNTLGKLSRYDIDVCEKHGWAYDETACEVDTDTE